MHTEELTRRDRPRERDAVSPALRDTAPALWQLVDARGRQVPLSSAGYVLRLGGEYQLRVAGAAVGPTPRLHVLSRPPFLMPKGAASTLTKHGRAYACLTFVAERDLSWWQVFRWPYAFHAGDLEVQCACDEAGTKETVLKCPLVARAPWTWGIIILLVVGALVGWCLDQVWLGVREICDNGSIDTLPERWRAMPGNPRLWLWPLILALANPCLAFLTTLVRLRRRRRTLVARFQERHIAQPRAVPPS